MKGPRILAALFAAALVLMAGCGVESGGERKTTPSGVTYVDLEEGDGTPAKFGDLIEITYTGTLADGRQFDKFDKNQPIRMSLGWRQVVDGLDEGIIGMKVGGKRKLWVPARLGYDIKGSSPKVPPNADLIYEVDLVKIFVFMFQPYDNGNKNISAQLRLDQWIVERQSKALRSRRKHWRGQVR